MLKVTIIFILIRIEHEIIETTLTIIQKLTINNYIKMVTVAQPSEETYIIVDFLINF